MSDDGRLRDVAEERGSDIDAGVAADPLRTDAGYKKTLRNEFNYVTTENALKTGPLRPSPDTYDFGDAVVNYARKHALFTQTTVRSIAQG